MYVAVTAISFEFFSEGPVLELNFPFGTRTYTWLTIVELMWLGLYLRSALYLLNVVINSRPLNGTGFYSREYGASYSCLTTQCCIQKMWLKGGKLRVSKCRGVYNVLTFQKSRGQELT